jgi:hypothetical protein
LDEIQLKIITTEHTFESDKTSYAKHKDWHIRT